MIDAGVDSLEDLKPPLQRFAKFFRFKVNRKFQQQGPGWAPRKNVDQTVARQRDYAAGLQRKLEKEVERAKKKAKTAASVKRRQRVLEEFKRIEAGTQGPSQLNDKQQKKLQDRIGRAKAKGARLLGKMSSSIKTEIRGGSLSVYSEIEWAGVHNDGGTAGHNAKIPQREFLALDEEDVEALEGFILDHIEESMSK